MRSGLRSSFEVTTSRMDMAESPRCPSTMFSISASTILMDLNPRIFMRAILASSTSFLITSH